MEEISSSGQLLSVEVAAPLKMYQTGDSFAGNDRLVTPLAIDRLDLRES